ncbi:MAG: GNAT family N-acetyltransferase [Alphaproteobacteria bacterium]
MIEFKIIEVGSELHRSEQRLRDEVLRRPLGRALSASDIERDKEGVHFAAVLDGEVVGCAGLYRQGDGVMRLRQMAVSPRLQRQNIGARLLSFAENWARDNAASRIETHARLVARGFYERCGYEAYGDVFEKISVPHIKMRKPLKS